MDDQTFMEIFLFANLDPTDTKRKLLINPNFAQGLDVRESNGDVLLTIQPGVSTEGASVINASGEKILTAKDGVADSVVYDFGHGESAVSMSDALGGSKINLHGEGFIGFTSPTFDGGIELQNQFHQPVASLEGGEILLERKADFADVSTSIPGNSFGSSSGLYDVTDTAGAADDAMDLLDAADLLGDFF